MLLEDIPTPRVFSGQRIRWGRAIVPAALEHTVRPRRAGDRHWAPEEIGHGAWERTPLREVLLVGALVPRRMEDCLDVPLPAVSSLQPLFLAPHTCRGIQRARISPEQLVDGSLVGGDLAAKGLSVGALFDLFAELEYANVSPQPIEIELARGLISPAWLHDAMRVLGLVEPRATTSEVARERSVTRAAVRTALAPYDRGLALLGLPAPLRHEPRPTRRAPTERSAEAGHPNARAILRELGGIAGARAIAARLQKRLGEPVTVRQIRDGFRNVAGVIKLGAGYYADRSDVVPIKQFVAELQAGSGRAWTMDEVVTEVLAAYPHGDPAAIRAWLGQITA